MSVETCLGKIATFCYSVSIGFIEGVVTRGIFLVATCHVTLTRVLRDKLQITCYARVTCIARGNFLVATCNTDESMAIQVADNIMLHACNLPRNAAETTLGTVKLFRNLQVATQFFAIKLRRG